MNLCETEGRASEAKVITDPSGAVHVFWAFGAPDAEEEGWGQAIYYARQQDGAWSEPVDVLISPGGRVARMHSVAVDSTGYLHIVWSGGNALFYSRAYAPEAESAGGWTAPAALTSVVGALEPAIAVGPDDALYVVWSQTRAGLVFVRSEDGGQNWSTPQTIFQADRDNELARWGRIAVDASGRLHAVCTHTINDPGHTAWRTDPNYLYYLRSDDRGATWTEPYLVTREPDFGEINVATFGTDTIHMVWNGRAGRHGRYHRWSENGGESWSDVIVVLAPAPQNPLGTGGLTGFPVLVTDATGTVHMVSATGGGDYYFRWVNGAWSSPELISPGLKGDGVTGTVNSLEQPSIDISQGNQLHVVFQDGFERIWYTSATIDAPYQPPLEMPTRDAAPTATPFASPTLAATGNQQPTPALALPAPAAPVESGSSYTPLLAGAVPAILLVGVVALVYSIRRRQ